MDEQGPLLPALKPHDWQGREAVICRPLIPDQVSPYMPVVAFGHDLPHTFQFLSKKQFPQGDLAQQLKLIEQAAMRNLRARELAWKTEDVEIGRSRVLRMVIAGDDYLAAERILDEAFIKKAHSILQAEMLIVAAPRRGLLLATSAKQPKEMLGRFGTAVSAQYHRADSPPISPLLFVAVEGRLVGMLKGMEDAAREAVREEVREEPKVYCTGAVTIDKTTQERIINIFAGGADLDRMARTIQNAFIQMIQKYGGEEQFGGKVQIHLVPDVTPRSEGFDESMTSFGRHLTEVAREFKFKTASGAAIEVSVTYGSPESPGDPASGKLLEKEIRAPMAGPLIAGGPGLVAPALPLDPRDGPSLVQTLLAGEPEIRSQAADYLRELLDPGTIGPLVNALSFPNTQVRRLASGILTLFGASAVEPLIPKYDEHDEGTRLAVVSTLGEIADPRAVEVLGRALLDTDGEVRAAAVRGLGGMKDPPSFVPLLSALLDPAADVQVAAASVLGEWGDSRAAPALALVAKEAGVEPVRLAASQALGKLGKDLAGLEGLLPRVRTWAAEEGRKRRHAIFHHALAWANTPQSLVALARETPAEWLDEVIAAVTRVRVERAQIGACLKIAAVVPEPYQTRAVERGLALAAEAKDVTGANPGAYWLAGELGSSGLPEAMQVKVVEQAIRLAAQVMAQGPQERKWAEVMIRLGRVEPKGLPAQVHSKLVGAALEAARGIADPSDRAHELMRLVPRVADRPAKLSVMGEALIAAMTIKGGQRRSERLNGLATSLPYDLKGEMLAIARRLESPAQRAEALGGLARNFREPLRSEAIHEALAVAPTIEHRLDRVDVLGRLAEIASEDQQAAIIETARRLPNPEDRAVTLGGLSRHLPEKQGFVLMKEALEIAWRIDSRESRQNAIGVLGGYMLPILKSDVATLRMGEAGVRARKDAWNSMGVGTSMRVELRELLRQLVPHISNLIARASGLSTVSLEFTGGKSRECIQEALDAVREVPDDWEKACVTVALAWYVQGKERPAILEEARGIVRRLDSRALCLSLKRELLGEYTEVLVGALALLERDPPDARGFDLAAVAMGEIDLLEKRQRQEALQAATIAARAIGDDWLRARAMVGLAKHHPKEVQAEAFEVAKEVSDVVRRAGVLTALAKVSNKGSMNGSKIERGALATAKEIEDPVARMRAIGELLDVAYFVNNGREARQSLDEVRAIADEMYRGNALMALAGHLPDDLQTEALKILQEMRDEAFRSSALSRIAEHMPPELHGELLETALRFEVRGYRVRALAPLTSILTGEMRQKAFQAAMAATRDQGILSRKIDMVLELAEKAPAELKSQVIHSAIPVIKAMPDVRRRIELLETLAKHAPGEEQDEILSAVEAARAELEGGGGGEPAAG